ncbi:hypothetical protein PoB_005636300 [Plakobranchus ocellatus]|uniref:Uncharacterized protein n=1 Tax=Plakobranchus ocellatus TaxID=259542 RepID=A0AAV4CD90_9GAST|nr:hypothetical protein PoB_005636300 [Plakobranchus ocellatus]
MCPLNPQTTTDLMDLHQLPLYCATKHGVRSFTSSMAGAEKKIILLGHAHKRKCSLMKDVIQALIAGKRGRGRSEQGILITPRIGLGRTVTKSSPP